MRTRGVLAVIFCVFLLASGVRTAAGYIEGQAENLTNIKFVHVEVHLDDEAKQGGVSLSKLKADVDLKLRLGGIELFTSKPSQKPMDGCVLFVRLNVLKLDSRTERVYYVSVDAEQAASLPRASSKHVVGKVKIWETAVFGLCDPKDLEREARETVLRVLDRFTHDYVTVNPKK